MSPLSAMSKIRQLVGQTAIYGLSSILGRVLNFFLTPLYVRVFTEADNGVIYDFYTLVAFIMVLFTYRMETAYFRFATDKDANNRKSFGTAFSSIIGSTFLAGGLIFMFSNSIAQWMKYPDHPEYIQIFGAILCLDALMEIPFAQLRLEGKAMRFAFTRLTGVGINLTGNIFFLLVCPWLKNNHGISAPFYDPTIGVGYVFIVNLLASSISLLMLLPTFKWNFEFDIKLWFKMLKYSAPLMVVATAGVINEMLDRQLLKYLLPYSWLENKRQLGIYGANYKLAMMISLFTQAFRYAAEPFFFKNSTDQKSPELFAKIAKFFTLFNLLGFLIIVLFLHIFKFYIGKEGSGFHEGLVVVPILLMANIFLGLYYNVSNWYRLTDRTSFGMWIALMGAGITILLNIWWIPVFGYLGSAWATLICYVLMVIVAYRIGLKFYPMSYDWAGILAYTALALIIVFTSWILNDVLEAGFWIKTLLAGLLTTIFLYIVYVWEYKKLKSS